MSIVSETERSVWDGRNCIIYLLETCDEKVCFYFDRIVDCRCDYRYSGSDCRTQFPQCRVRAKIARTYSDIRSITTAIEQMRLDEMSCWLASGMTMTRSDEANGRDLQWGGVEDIMIGAEPQNSCTVDDSHCLHEFSSSGPLCHGCQWIQRCSTTLIASRPAAADYLSLF